MEPFCHLCMKRILPSHSLRFLFSFHWKICASAFCWILKCLHNEFKIQLSHWYCWMFNRVCLGSSNKYTWSVTKGVRVSAYFFISRVKCVIQESVSSKISEWKAKHLFRCWGKRKQKRMRKVVMFQFLSFTMLTKLFPSLPRIFSSLNNNKDLTLKR